MPAQAGIQYPPPEDTGSPIKPGDDTARIRTGMKASVIVFPGSNCDRDAAVALEAATGQAPAMVWHGDSVIPQSDLIVLPGGFSYGDYLRCGAMAAHSPVMREVVARARAGTPVLGICNGFQVLTEAGLLPGVLMRNATLKFICRDVELRVERNDSDLYAPLPAGEVVRFPIAHKDGQLFRRRCDAGAARRRRPRRLPLLRRAGNVTRKPIPTARATTSPASTTRRAPCSG